MPSRRPFLAALLGVGAAGVAAVLALPVIRFVLHPLLATTTEIQWSEVGTSAELKGLQAPVKKLVKVEQRDGWRKIVSDKAVYVIEDAEGQLKVLSPICPHLGCSVALERLKRPLRLSMPRRKICCERRAHQRAASALHG